MDSHSHCQAKEKVCEICGGNNPRSEFLLVTCSVCNTTCEHVYCMGRKVKHEVPEDWVCESCLTGSDSISMESEERVALESFQEDEAVTRAMRNEQFSGTTVARLSTFNESKASEITSVASEKLHAHQKESMDCDISVNKMKNSTKKPPLCSRPVDPVSVPRRRSKSGSYNLKKKVRENGGKPLPIQFDLKDGTYYAVGDNAKMFVRLIGNTVGCDIPPYYPSWKDVPNDYKMKILPKIEEYFVLDRCHREFPNILLGIDRECADLYRHRKGGYKNHFKKVGGDEGDIERALRNPAKGLDDDTWKKCIELWVDPKNMERAKKNAENGKKIKYPSLHGSQSYAAFRYKKANPETKELPSVISTWYDFHYRRGIGFVNKAAEDDYLKMKAKLSSSSAKSASIDEKEIFTKVLGERRGHSRGVGRKLKGSVLGSSSQSSAPFSPQPMVPPPGSVSMDVTQNVTSSSGTKSAELGDHSVLGSSSQSSAPLSTQPMAPPPGTVSMEVVQNMMKQFASILQQQNTQINQMFRMMMDNASTAQQQPPQH